MAQAPEKAEAIGLGTQGRVTGGWWDDSLRQRSPPVTLRPDFRAFWAFRTIPKLPFCNATTFRL